MRKLTTSELNRPGLQEFSHSIRLPVTVVLDNVRSAYNVGSVFRTCDAFAIEKIILCGITAAPPNREVLKTALGSTASIPWIHVSAVEVAVLELKKKNFQIIVTEQTDESVSLEQFFPPADHQLALVFGNEINGVSETVMKLAHTAIEIPQFGTKHSFNISVAAGIVLWDFQWKLRKRT